MDKLLSIIQQCREGRPEGFAWLLEEYGTRLYAYFLRTTGSAADAEDLLQELFLKLIKKIKSYRHQGRFENWVFRLAANMARDHARRLRRKPILFSQYSPESDNSEPAANVPSTAASPYEQLQAHEQQEQLDQALKQLSSLDREIILLRHYGQLSFKEIAEHFQIPIGTALAKVHRGLKRLRELVAQSGKKT